MEKTVDVVVDGGKATAAPPLGPALGPLGVNIQKIVDEINEKTRDLDGMRVPVKVIVNTATKNFRIEVGKPPASALILSELKIDKGSALAGKDRVGDLTPEQVKKIAKAKFGSDEETYLNQIKGTCRSMGITIGNGALTNEELKKAEQDKMQVMEGMKTRTAAPQEGAAAPVKAPEEAKAPKKKRK